MEVGMRLWLLDVLRCPACKGRLTTTTFEVDDKDAEEIRAGLIQCDCGANYALWRGVPRMFPPEIGMPQGFVAEYKQQLGEKISLEEVQVDSTTERFSFSLQWSTYEYGELTWELDLDDRVDYFYRYLGKSRGELDQTLVLDAGCGNGTLTAAIAGSGPRIIGFDYSCGVERAEAHKRKFAGEHSRRLCYVQGDVQHPPFDDDAFDAIYSDGVLHHTSSTRKSFDALAPLVKPGGLFFVWLYRSDLKGFLKYKLKLVHAIKAILRPLPLVAVRALCFVGAFILNLQLRVRKLLGLPSKRRLIPLRQKAVNLFDTFSPTYGFSHTPDEVREWYTVAGYVDPVDRTLPGMGDYGFGMIGKRAR